MILGISDPWVAAAYILSFASAGLCVIYGLTNWNKGDESPEDLKKDAEWMEKEVEAEEDL